MANNSTAIFVDSQLPAFVRDDNPNFAAFIKAYYSWLNSSNNAIYQSKNMLSYSDIDTTTDDFIRYFLNDFLPHFPNSVVLDERKLVKAARNFYQQKGNIESIQFLFRVLYGKDADIYYPKENILKASDGKWTLPQSIRLVADGNENFDISLLEKRIGVGSISNTTCVIESAKLAVDPNLGINIIELFISNLSKPFDGVENLIVNYGVDQNNNPLIFSQKIIGAISSIQIDPNNRGLKYRGTTRNSQGLITYEGDPVVVIGGLANDPEARKAVAYVGNATTGSISTVSVEKGGYAYRVYPNSVTTVIPNASDTTGAGANVIVDAIDTGNSTFLLINTDSIFYKANANLTSMNIAFANFAFTNANTLLGTALSFTNVQFAPLQSMNVVNGGGGYTAPPSINVQDSYYTDYVTDLANIGDFTDVVINRQWVDDLGHFAAVEVANAGIGYDNTADRIICQSAIGYNAAFDFITDGSGRIQSVIINNQGEGYFTIPNLVIANTIDTTQNSNGSGAILIGYGYGQGARLNVAVNKIGLVTDIRLASRGFDYISTPNVSLRVQDLIINPISNSQSFTSDAVIYQGVNTNAATYIARVDSYNVFSSVLRVYNYQGTLNVAANLSTIGINCTVNTAVTGNVTSYGNGKAKANAIFLNGVINYPGFFYNTDGFLSADKYLQDSDQYHNYSYTIVVEKALQEYKNALIQIAHPAGTDMLGKFSIKAEENEGNDLSSKVGIDPSITGRVSVNAFDVNKILVGSGSGNVVISSFSVTATSNNPTFAIGANANNEAYVIASRNGLIQVPNTEYVLDTSNNITFTTDCRIGDVIETRFFNGTANNINISSTSALATVNQNTFTMSSNVIGPEYVIATRNGLIEVPNVHYTVVNNKVTFTSNCRFGDYVDLRAFTGNVGIGGNVIMNTYSTFANANQNTFTLTSNVYDENSIIVSRNGLIEVPKLQYLITANTNLTFTTPCRSNDYIEVRIFNGDVGGGSGTRFLSTASPGDLITFNFNDASRPTFTKVINTVLSDFLLRMESNTQFTYTNTISVVNGTSLIYGSNTFAGLIGVNDITLLNVSGNSISSYVLNVSGNVLTVNTVFNDNATNILMEVYPSINAASYLISREPT